MRSGISVVVITRVMLAESREHPKAVSPKGAIGCMQIMPVTWVYISKRYGLGADPFDARMNMIGGALYLAELIRQFGLPGAYSAYNAGPARYVRFAANGFPLPAETVAYTARLGGAVAPAVAEPSRARWQQASLFVGFGGEVRTPASDRPHLESAMPPNAGHPPVPDDEPRALCTAASLFPLAAKTRRDRQ